MRLLVHAGTKPQQIKSTHTSSIRLSRSHSPGSLLLYILIVVVLVLVIVLVLARIPRIPSLLSRREVERSSTMQPKKLQLFFFTQKALLLSARMCITGILPGSRMHYEPSIVPAPADSIEKNGPALAVLQIRSFLMCPSAVS